MCRPSALHAWCCHVCVCVRLLWKTFSEGLREFLCLPSHVGVTCAALGRRKRDVSTTDSEFTSAHTLQKSHPEVTRKIQLLPACKDSSITSTSTQVACQRCMLKPCPLCRPFGHRLGMRLPPCNQTVCQPMMSVLRCAVMSPAARFTGPVCEDAAT